MKIDERLSRKNSRTVNTIYNFISSVGGQLVTILMHFFIRTVFINTLGKAYLGVGGLFSNILTMLSLTELGVGSAILFKLYDPIARGDHHRVAVLMKFYKNVYRLIGLVVSVLGLCLIPFLPNLIKDYDKLQALNLNAVLIFCLYLAKSVSSYLFFAYKSAIIRANQKEYLINIFTYIFTILGGVAQIVCLLVFPNFEIYIAISILQVVLHNVAIAMLANRMYPYINEKTEDRIEKTEIKGLLKDCGALFLYKLNGVVLKATDNIVISTFIGIDMVGMYSNYYIFYTTINGLFTKIFGSVAHSLGNLHTTHDDAHEYEIFEVVNLLTAILGGTAFAGLFVVGDEFVLHWIGASWQLAQPFSFLMGFEIYTLAVRVALSKYRTTMGLFQQAKWRPLAGMIINLVVSIALVNFWGICGVLVGTLVADWITFMWYDPMIIHKYGFKNYKPVSAYYQRFLLYTGAVLAVSALDYWLCRHLLTGLGWFSVIFHAVICLITVPGVLLLLRCKKPDGQYVLNLLKKNVRKLRRKLLRRGGGAKRK